MDSLGVRLTWFDCNSFLFYFDIDKNVGNLVTMNIIQLVMFQVRRSKM